MPKAKRERRERTDNYALILQWCRTPEQRLYEGIRPITLFGVPPAERAQETGLAESSLRRAADAFDTQGMISLFRPTKAQRESHHRSLPVMMRQLIVDLKAEYPGFTLGEIADICAIQFDGRRPSHHTVKEVLADGPPPSRTTRQFPRYEDIPESEERRLAVIRLHAQGWSISTIARYLDVSRPTIYATLKRWVDEGVRGLPDKSRANTGKLGVDLPTRNLIRKKQEENPLLGEYRINAALKQLGISVPPRTCGRIMAEDRRLYGVNPPQQDRHKPKPHPFKATYREETPLAQYTVQYQPDKKNFKAVPTARRFETPYRSPQGWLWELDDTTWKLAKRLPDYAPRKRRRKPTHIQPTLLR